MSKIPLTPPDKRPIHSTPPDEHHVRPAPPTPADRLRQQPGWVQEELEALRKREPVILEALASPENRELFLKDPAALLQRLKIPLSGPFKQKLRANRSAADLLKPVALHLPNGQYVRVHVNVRFTKARD